MLAIWLLPSIAAVHGSRFVESIGVSDRDLVGSPIHFNINSVFSTLAPWLEHRLCVVGSRRRRRRHQVERVIGANVVFPANLAIANGSQPNGHTPPVDDLSI